MTSCAARGRGGLCGGAAVWGPGSVGPSVLAAAAGEVSWLHPRAARGRMAWVCP